MSCPKMRGWAALNKLCRYLRGVPRMVQRVPIVGETSEYPRTRKSTNGGGIVWNGACLKVWSTTQTVVAFEFWRGGVLAKDLGIDLKIRVHTDSSACRGICGRTGIGKVRHMAVPLLWLQ